MALSIVIKGAVAFVIGAFLISMFLGIATDNVASVDTEGNNDFVKSVNNNLKEWENKFEISGITVLICLVTGIIPIPLNIKIPALLIEGLGGSIAWMFV